MNPYLAVLLGFLGWCVVATVVGLFVGAVVKLRDRDAPPERPTPCMFTDKARQSRRS